MEKNNPNKTFRAKHKVAEPITITQIREIRNQALTLRHPFGVLISAALGRRMVLEALTYRQAEIVIEYGDGHIKRRAGGR